MSVLICLPDRLEAEVISILAQTRQETLIARRCADLAEVLAAARAKVGSFAVITASVEFLDVSILSELRDHVGVGIVADTADNLDGLRFVDVEILSPVAVEIAQRIQHATIVQPVSRPQTSVSGEGQIIAVWGPPGSHGRSTLVADMAAHLSAQAVTVDLDMFAPSLAQIFDVDETSALIGVIRQLDQGREVDLEQFVVSAGKEFGGANVLVGMNSPQRWPEISVSVLPKLWTLLRSSYSAAVVDVSGGLGVRPERRDRYAVTRASVEQADVVVQVASGTPLGLRRLVDHLEETRGIVTARQIIVLTGVRSSALGRSPARQATGVLRELGITDIPIVTVSDNRARLDEALLSGRSARIGWPKSAYAADIAKVCAQLFPEQ
ncbi:MAG: hypothetical protein WBH82_00200 [Arcanobacterium sp.]